MKVQKFKMQRVYVVECDGYYKIGIAGDVNKRISQISAMNPNGVDIVCNSVPLLQAHRIEKYLHKTYRKNQINGEWFKFDPEEQLEIINYVLSL